MSEAEKYNSFEEALHARKMRSQEHDLMRDSHEYRGVLTYIQRITWEYLHCIACVNLLATRFSDIAQNMLLLKSMDHITESALSIKLLIENGCLNPAKREMRYMLEAAVKYLYTDQKLSGKNYQEKVNFFRDQIPRGSIKLPEPLILSAFDAGLSEAFHQDITRFYGQASSFVHPSVSQLDEYERRLHRHASIGFESARDLESVKTLCLQLYDMMMVLLLHGVGLSSAGDFFIIFVDNIPKYRMLKGKYFKELNRYFDYKAERRK